MCHILVLLAVFGWVAGKAIQTEEADCVSFEIPEEELNYLRNVSQKIEIFLSRKADGEYQELVNVSVQSGISHDSETFDSNSPVESLVLHNQMTLHRDVEEMLKEWKAFFSGLTIPKHRQKRDSIKTPKEQEVLLRSATKNRRYFYDNKFSVQSGISHDSETFDSNSPVESLVLHNQMTLHRDVEEMLKEWKAFFSGFTIPKHRQKRAGTKPQKEPEGLPRSAPQNRYSPTDVAFRPEDCSELLVVGQTKSGVYDIYPFRCQCSPPVKVMCDMDTDGGGWTVIVARQNQSKPLNFTQNWQTYKKGFGSPEGEYWLGNEIIHILTSGRKQVLRLEAKDGFGREVSGEWNIFGVDSEKEKYKLTAVDPNAENTASDAFTAYHNGNYFSTFDMDNDKDAKRHCSELRKGGWWYKDCYRINPTGIMRATGTTGIRMAWSKKDSTNRYATWLQLKIRPKICSDLIPVAKLNTHNCVLK